MSADICSDCGNRICVCDYYEPPTVGDALDGILAEVERVLLFTDALVAEKVLGMGWKEGVPHYSTDIAAAWGVVEKMVADGWIFEVEGTACHPGQWCAGFIKGDDIADSVAPTAPLAICLAALKAMENK